MALAAGKSEQDLKNEGLQGQVSGDFVTARAYHAGEKSINLIVVSNRD